MMTPEELAALQKRYVEVQYAYVMANNPGDYVWKSLTAEAKTLTVQDMRDAIGDDE